MTKNSYKFGELTWRYRFFSFTGKFFGNANFVGDLFSIQNSFDKYQSTPSYSEQNLAVDVAAPVLSFGIGARVGYSFGSFYGAAAGLLTDFTFYALSDMKSNQITNLRLSQFGSIK